jgi:heat shock protein HtpX
MIHGSIKTYLLMAGLTALFMMCGAAMGGQSGMMMALLFSVATNFFSYYYSDKIVRRMMNLQPADRTTHPQLYAMTEELARRGGLPMPALYIMHSDQPNAFATGRNPQHGAVAVTTGLMRVLDKDELAGVIAHELAHIKNRDSLLMTMTATIAGAISALGNMMLFMGRPASAEGEQRGGGLLALAMMILAPIAAMLVQMCISRTREYSADAVGAQICGKPLALASALAKIEQVARGKMNVPAEQNPANAHLFIINPLHAHAIDGLFSTHPRTQERIRRLQAMEGTIESIVVETSTTRRIRRRPWE